VQGYLFLLALAQQLHVLRCELVVHPLLIDQLGLALLFFLNLLVQFKTNQSAALLFTQQGLLLLLVVQQLVEFLDGRPLVFFLDLRVDLGLAIET